MCEAEIMIGGYTAVVATGTISICKLIYNKKIKKLQKEITELKKLTANLNSKENFYTKPPS